MLHISLLDMDFITGHERSKAVLLLWIIKVAWYVCTYMVFSIMVSLITVAYYVSCFIQFCKSKYKIGKIDVPAVLIKVAE